MICVECHQETETDPCSGCAGAPLLDGRWRLDAIVGNGATGTVFRASAVTGDVGPVAIKELPLRSDPKRQELALREARVLRQLQHPSIPQYLEEIVAGHGRGRCLYLVEEFVEGESLARMLDGHRFDEREVLEIIAEACDILAWLHNLAPPVIHRDVKPGNLIRRARDQRWMLVDFGAVRDVLRAEAAGSTVAGTFGYMAPEQFRGEARAATDLYAVGATAVALLSRQDPAALHDRDGRFGWQAAVKVSPGTSGLLTDLLATDPERRLGDARVAAARARRLRADLDRASVAAAEGPGGAAAWEEMETKPAVEAIRDPFQGMPTPELPATQDSLPPARAGRTATAFVSGAVAAVLAIVGIVAVFSILLIEGARLGGTPPAPDPASTAPPAAQAPAPAALPAPVADSHVEIFRPAVDPDNHPETVIYKDHPMPEGLPRSDLAAVVLSRPQPAFPAEGRGQSAVCTGVLDVNPDGTVGRALIEGCPVIFRSEQVLGTWRFDPLPSGVAPAERAWKIKLSFSSG